MCEEEEEEEEEEDTIQGQVCVWGGWGYTIQQYKAWFVCEAVGSQT